MKLQLKINNEWAVLPSDISMSIHRTSPLFETEAGDMSYPFELSLSANSHIFKNLSDPHGYIRLSEFHGLPAEIWYDGMQVFSGQTEVEESIDFNEDKISINIVSANRTFAEMIDGMNCRDVEMIDDINIGKMAKPSIRIDTTVPISLLTYKRVTSPDGRYDEQPSEEELDELIEEGFSVLKNNFSRIITKTELIHLTIDQPSLYLDSPEKVDAEYPADKFCNFRLARPKSDGSNTEKNENSTGNGYDVVEPGGINCAPNFFVMYFLDCLFHKLGIDCNKDAVLDIEDMRRLFMLNIWPDGRASGTDSYSTNYYFDDKDGRHIPRICHLVAYKFSVRRENNVLSHSEIGLRKIDSSLTICNAIATSKNFPDTDVKNIIDSLADGFGVLFYYEQETKQMTLLLKRDIMRNTVVENPKLTIVDKFITRELYGGVELTYGNEDDTAFNYDMTEDDEGKVFGGKSEVVEKDDYSLIVTSRRSRYDMETKFDKNTGNAFRVKVNENTGDDPQLFEVGGYNSCKYGVDKRSGKEPEKIQLPFSPVTINDIWGWRKSLEESENQTIFIPSSEEDSETCVFVNEECFNTENDLWYASGAPEGNLVQSVKGVGSIGGNGFEEFCVTNGTSIDVYIEATITTQIAGEGSYELGGNSTNTNPLSEANIGLQLGIIRGSGSTAHIEYILDYDGEGNDAWVNIPGSKGGASADSISMWGTPYDYNGDTPGGTTGHLSLKLDGRKVKSYDEKGDPVFYETTGDNAKRGLVPQLLEDYLYFLAHKTPITLTVHGTLTELKNLPFLKKVKIGTHIGFIYSIDFDINEDGVQEAEIVMWELNK